MVYGATDKKRQSVGMWSGAISPTYGSFRIICERDAYLNARYEARDAVAPSIDLHIQKTDAQTGKIWQELSLKYLWMVRKWHLL